MKSQLIGNQPVRILIISLIVRLYLFQRPAEIVDALTDHRSESCIYCRAFSSRFIDIHIKNRSNTAGQIFHNCQLIEPVNIFARQLGLCRKYPGVQPFIQLHIVRM